MLVIPNKERFILSQLLSTKSESHGDKDIIIITIKCNECSQIWAKTVMKIKRQVTVFLCGVGMEIFELRNLTKGGDSLGT